MIGSMGSSWRRNQTDTETEIPPTEKDGESLMFFIGIIRYGFLYSDKSIIAGVYLISLNPNTTGIYEVSFFFMAMLDHMLSV